MSERTGEGHRSMAADLVAWGKAITLETVGHRSGQPRSATIGFVLEPDGSLLVAAGARTTAWARNLVAQPECQVVLDGRRRDYRGVRLEGRDGDAAVRALILKYGTPAERLGGGPAFRLLPVDGAERA